MRCPQWPYETVTMNVRNNTDPRSITFLDLRMPENQWQNQTESNHNQHSGLLQPAREMHGPYVNDEDFQLSNQDAGIDSSAILWNSDTLDQDDIFASMPANTTPQQGPYYTPPSSLRYGNYMTVGCSAMTWLKEGGIAPGDYRRSRMEDADKILSKL